MERLITTKDVMERYGCTRQTARKYIRQCNPYMEKPLATYEWAFVEWESSRTVTKPMNRLTLTDFNEFKRSEKVVVPRRR